jgi:lysozyme
MKRRILVIVLITLTVLILVGYLEYRGFIWHNEIFAQRYDVKGLDVSNHQGEIDWEKVSESRYSFVFTKATEGNDYRDKYFQRNWDEAKKNGLLRGAYHYFTTGSSGNEQAENFISLVPDEDGMLPPVIDIEVWGDSKEVYVRELTDLITRVEQHYGKKPILYVMYPYYEEYIKGSFEDYPIWIRDIVKYPSLSDGRKWTFWQYCNRGHVKGIATYVDINCFSGSTEELLELAK